MAGHTAFGVEPNRRAPYELRQARYERLGEVLAAEVQRVDREEHRPAELLDVGTSDGRILRYLEPRLEGAEVRPTGVDLFPNGKERVFRSEDWRLLEMDLEDGMPSLRTGAYDIVVCEQVLEHIHRFGPVLEDIERVLRPGGLAVLGVPIFPHGFHLLRPAVIKAMDLIAGPQHHAHVRAWSRRTFLADLERLGSLEVSDVRGFRIVSGGPLRRLEFHRWWWRLNRRVGQVVPGFCTEIQVVLRKKASSRQEA